MAVNPTNFCRAYFEAATGAVVGTEGLSLSIKLPGGREATAWAASRLPPLPAAFLFFA